MLVENRFVFKVKDDGIDVKICSIKGGIWGMGNNLGGRLCHVCDGNESSCGTICRNEWEMSRWKDWVL